MNSVKLLVLILGLTLGLTSQAQFKVPALTGPVVDQVGVLSAGQKAGLAQDLQNLNSQNNIQLQVLIVASLDGDVIEQAAIQVFDQWQLGKKGEDRGILFMIATEDRKLRIEVGRGLEGDLPDVTANRIIRQVVVPLFKEQRVAEGILAGVGTIKQVLVAHDPNAIPEEKQAARKNTSGLKDKLTLLLFLLFLIGPPFLRLFGFFGLASGRSRWGGGGWSSGSGGGWGGGGGGSSGGGSSGSW